MLPGIEKSILLLYNTANNLVDRGFPGMNKAEFYEKYCELITYYQCIEADLKGICASLLADEERGWFERLDDYESDPLGKMIQEIQILQEKKNCALFSSEDFEALNAMRKTRNYWVHQCFVGYTHVTFHKDIVRPPYGGKLNADLNEAIDWDQKLTEIGRPLIKELPTM